MFMYIIKLDKSIMYAEFDDPTSFAILSNKDLSKDKPFGLVFVKKTDKLEQKDFKKLSISSQSILYIVLLVLMAIIMFFLR